MKEGKRIRNPRFVATLPRLSSNSLFRLQLMMKNLDPSTD
jgi:hypothetical protein